jgi:hypothetical protein
LQGKEPYENQTQDLCFVRAAVWKDHIRFGYLHFVTPGFSWPYMMDAPLFLNITVFFACTPDQTFSGCAQFLLFVSALGLAKEPHCC